MEEEIKIGDIVFIKDEVVRRYKGGWALWQKQVAESKDRPFTVVSIDGGIVFPYYLSALDNTFGTNLRYWKEKMVKYLPFTRHEIEKRNGNGNQISLYELNKGL